MVGLYFERQFLTVDEVRRQFGLSRCNTLASTHRTILTTRSFDRVMRHMERLGFENYVRPTGRDPDAEITSRQLEMIQALYLQLGWDDRARQVGFHKRQCHKPWPQTRQDASKVIEGLKALLHKAKPSRGCNNLESAGF